MTHTKKLIHGWRGRMSVRRDKREEEEGEKRAREL